MTKITAASIILLDTDTVQVIDTEGSNHYLNSNEYNLDKFINNEINTQSLPKNVDLSNYNIKGQLHNLSGYVVPKDDNIFNYLKESFDKIEPTNINDVVVPDDSVLITFKDDVCVPYADKMSAYLHTDQNKKGLKNFLKKLSKLHKKCKHSVEELLEFMEKAEMPICNDGYVLGYKKLARKDNYFVDLHTRRIKQNLGSIVKMKKKEVDNDRRNACSNGLHVASLDYLSWFGSGCYNETAIFLVKVNPFDIISVPEYDVTKLRCSKYHIVHKLNKNAYDLVHDKDAITNDNKTAKAVKNIIKGYINSAQEIVNVENDVVVSVDKLHNKVADKSTNAKAYSLAKKANKSKSINEYNKLKKQYKK